MTISKDLSLHFLGAAGTVTGSKHLLQTPEGDYLIDCGLFQGLKALRKANWDPIPIDMGRLRAVLLTHAHLDHCGALPLLYSQGFRGKIYCTAPTRDLAEVILRDSARIQEEDAAIANRKGYTKHAPAVPLYTEELVEKVLPLMEIVPMNDVVEISPELSVAMHPNGHILGSCFLQVRYRSTNIVFSGDLGRPVSTLLREPTPITPADYVIMESTYGDRVHPDISTLDELAEVINDTLRAKGNLLIPSFAVGRAQELMHLVNDLKLANRIPDVPVFLDSPMGANATEIFRRHQAWHKLSPEQCNALFERVSIVSRFEETLDVIDQAGSKVIIAASGMLAGGRVLYYLEKYLESKRNTVLLTGYQSEGTRGRALVDGAHELRMHGSYYKVRASVKSLSSMSGHADQQEMMDWLSKLPSPPKCVYLVHGENGPRDAFRLKIESTLGWKVEMPMQGNESKL